MMIERRATRFTERLSMFMAVASAMGGFYVLLDPIFAFEISGGHTLKIGGEGFSADLKGAVVSLILIGGWTAIKEYWLGSSASGQHQAESMSRIAEASAPAAAAAVAANAATTNFRSDEVKIDAEKVEIRDAGAVPPQTKGPTT
jgi:hypothetical protein